MTSATHNNASAHQGESRKGFTLIELLVVIAIIGLLASIILASLNTARAKGRDARRISDMKSVQLALELYFDQNSYYPQQSAALTATPSSSNLPSALAPTYISAIPTDPSASSPYFYQYQSLDSSGAICTEADYTQCVGYLLVAELEAGSNSSGWTGTLPSGDPSTLCTAGSGAPYPYCVHS